MKVGIIGGAGYTAGELIRLLINHPNIEISTVTSRSQVGLPVSFIHKDLIGEIDLYFSSSFSNEDELIFLCLGHGHSKSYLDNNPTLMKKKIIDLSTDFRPRDNELKFIYGLPELNKKLIKDSNFIANPGCFATAIQLAFLPLAKQKLIKNDLHVTGITGSTGAGQKPQSTTHFSWRNNNLSIYKLFEHQHLSEIEESLKSVQSDFDSNINFVPIRGNFSRGIFISGYTDSDLSEQELTFLYKSFYRDSPFTIVTDHNLSLKDVVNTNKCLLKVSKKNGKVHVTSLIDNLLKGASGQAVQNMNIINGWNETLGLKLKSIGF